MNKIYYLPKFQPGGKTHEISAVRDNTRVAWIPESNFTPKMTDYKPDPNLLQNIGETILDFTPIVGDIKGLTVDPYRAYKENGWRGGLTMMGLGLLGLIPFVGDAAKKSGKIIKKSYIKPWRSDPSKTNKATSYAFENKPKQFFELVEDQEPGYYSVHFKTDRGALTEEEKRGLVKAIYDDLPKGAKLFTWGEVSKGGFSGIDRFRIQMGMIPTNELRTVGVKSQNTPDEIVERFGYTKNSDGTISFPILLKQK